MRPQPSDRALGAACAEHYIGTHCRPSASADRPGTLTSCALHPAETTAATLSSGFWRTRASPSRVPGFMMIKTSLSLAPHLADPHVSQLELGVPALAIQWAGEENVEGLDVAVQHAPAARSSSRAGPSSSFAQREPGLHWPGPRGKARAAGPHITAAPLLPARRRRPCPPAANPSSHLLCMWCSASVMCSSTCQMASSGSGRGDRVMAACSDPPGAHSITITSSPSCRKLGRGGGARSGGS